MRTVQLPKEFDNHIVPILKSMRYVRTEDRTPVGVVLISERGYVGWSLLNVEAGDKWDRIFGIKKAS